jgi:hypothetical protein
MRTNTILWVSVAACSAVSWWPLILEPALDLPWWVPLAVIALCSCFASALSNGRWLPVFAASAVATPAGLWVGFTLWPVEDGIAQSYAGFAALAATIAVALVSLVAGLVGRRLSVAGEMYRRFLWLVLVSSIAFGPVTLALRPSIIAHRVARNDRIAAQRFQSLKTAVEQTRMGSGDSVRICNGESLKHNYSGPPFSAKNWRYIAGNYVKEDGYLFGIWIDCSQPVRYTIDVRPARGRADGTRTFCTDESGRVGCGMEWNRSGNDCVPCAK